MKKIFPVICLFLVLPQCAAAQTAATSCTNLTSDVSSGMTDSAANGEIFELQTFLQKSGYLSATPNGHFGPATLAAVLSFQSANGISATGYVGPLTRAFIENKTCSTTNTTTKTSPPVVPTPQSIAVTSPGTNESVTLGSTYTIRWSGTPVYNYSIVLENQNGVGEGIIASSLSTGNSYVWQVGKIISPNGAGYASVGPGTYRIHIENLLSGVSSSDLYSALFTIAAPPIAINSIVPSSASADGTSAVVIFGSGFLDSPVISIDGYYRANTLFVSADEKVIVFSLPTNIPAGYHTLTVSTQYASSSNALPITITNPTSN